MGFHQARVLRLKTKNQECLYWLFVEVFMMPGLSSFETASSLEMSCLRHHKPPSWSLESPPSWSLVIKMHHQGPGSQPCPDYPQLLKLTFTPRRIRMREKPVLSLSLFAVPCRMSNHASISDQLK